MVGLKDKVIRTYIEENPETVTVTIMAKVRHVLKCPLFEFTLNTQDLFLQMTRGMNNWLIMNKMDHSQSSY